MGLQVAGVDNKVARYGEDRQLSQRLTPFAERCAAIVVALCQQQQLSDLKVRAQLCKTNQKHCTACVAIQLLAHGLQCGAGGACRGGVP